MSGVEEHYSGLLASHYTWLELDRPESVMVHDLVYRRDGGRWVLEKSCYRKLRLGVDWLEGAKREVGFSVERRVAGRLIRLVGKKV